MANDDLDSFSGNAASPASTAPGSGGSASALKVELDIDDAPFLEEPEEQLPPKKEEPKPVDSAPVAKSEGASKPSPGLLAKILEQLKANKKLFVLAGGGAVLAIVIAFALMFFLGGEKTPPPPADPGPTRLTVPDAPPRQDAPPAARFSYDMERFVIERRGTEGEIRFLQCRFSVPTDDPVLFSELRAKNIVLRDALYYYLSNKALTFLTDPDATLALKQDVISVINEHISSTKIRDLYIEEYFITGR